MIKEQFTINLDNELLKSLHSRCDKERTDISDFIESSVEKRYLHPFLSRRHLRNYYYLTNTVAAGKEYNKNRQIAFYLLAYDGIYMEHIHNIYKIVKDKEALVIPKDLNDILHPGFCLIDAACEVFLKGELTGIRSNFKWLKYDDNEMIIIMNAIMMTKNVLLIKDELYSPENFLLNIDSALNKTYSLEEYASSSLLYCYSDKIQGFIKELFHKITENGMVLNVVPSLEDELTFTLITYNGKKLAIVSSSDDGTNLRIGINKWKNSMHGNMLYCYDMEDIGAVVNDDKIPDLDLLTKYKEII